MGLMLAQGLTDRRWPGGLEGSAGPAPTSPPSPVALGPSLSVDWPHTDLLRGPGGLRAAPARVLGIPAVAGWRVCSLQLSRIPGLPPACPPPHRGSPHHTPWSQNFGQPLGLHTPRSAPAQPAHLTKVLSRQRPRHPCLCLSGPGHSSSQHRLPSRPRPTVAFWWPWCVLMVALCTQRARTRVPAPRPSPPGWQAVGPNLAVDGGVDMGGAARPGLPPASWPQRPSWEGGGRLLCPWPMSRALHALSRSEGERSQIPSPPGPAGPPSGTAALSHRPARCHGHPRQEVTLGQFA